MRNADGLKTAPTFSAESPGVRLIATGVDWACGDGLEVAGRGEAILMVMAGRPDALNQEQAYQSAGSNTDSAASTLSSTGSNSLRPQAATIRETTG